jgi:ubiquitin-protein ligase
MEIEENNSNDVNTLESMEDSIYVRPRNINKERRGILNFHNRMNIRQNQLSSAEIRLRKDIEELKKNQKIGQCCDEIILNDYKRIEGTENFQIIVEFINHFSLKFIFTSDYPFEPPKITFFAGNQYPFIFDCNGNIILNLITKENWSPTFWISTLILYIEKKIYLNTNPTFYNKPCNSEDYKIGKIFMIKKGNYNKRNWNDYLNSINFRESIEYSKFRQLKGNKFNKF